MTPSRSIELDIDIGADARDWSSIQVQEKLRPVETELRRIEELVGEVVSEMEYLRTREQKLRDTNESTNERVKWFAFGTMGMLIGLGAWQVVYLRAYFRFLPTPPPPLLPWSMDLVGIMLILMFTGPSTLSRVAGYVEMILDGCLGCMRLYHVLVSIYAFSLAPVYDIHLDFASTAILHQLLPFYYPVYHPC